MPAALAYPLQGKRYNWAYETEPEPYMNNRRMECGRGKGLGGSPINGMCYIRGVTRWIWTTGPKSRPGTLELSRLPALLPESGNPRYRA